MNFEDDDIIQIVENIWQTVLKLPIVPANKEKEIPNFIITTIQISGSWSGTIIIKTSKNMAKKAASVMFSSELSMITAEDSGDALCELTNMIAGNLKTFFSGTNHLSLPSISYKCDDETDAKILFEQFLQCQKEPLKITILEK